MSLTELAEDTEKSKSFVCQGDKQNTICPSGYGWSLGLREYGESASHRFSINLLHPGTSVGSSEALHRMVYGAKRAREHSF